MTAQAANIKDYQTFKGVVEKYIATITARDEERMKISKGIRGWLQVACALAAVLIALLGLLGYHEYKTDHALFHQQQGRELENAQYLDQVQKGYPAI